VTNTLLPATLLLISLSAQAAGPAQSLDEKPQSRGALLYDTHCTACHDREVHWRDKSTVTDWKSLVAQVRLWQVNGDLKWNEEDIIEVSRHLDMRYYHLPEPKK